MVSIWFRMPFYNLLINTMDKYEKLIADYASLPYEDQKKKLLLMLDELKDTNQVFVDAMNLINKRDDLPADFFVGVYTDIINMWKYIEEYKKQKNLETATELKDKMQQLKQIEEQQRTQENPDDLLSGI